ncbi:hypothetical protein FQZ97_1060470 [compost metagenome]
MDVDRAAGEPVGLGFSVVRRLDVALHLGRGEIAPGEHRQVLDAALLDALSVQRLAGIELARADEDRGTTPEAGLDQGLLRPRTEL